MTLIFFYEEDFLLLCPPLTTVMQILMPVKIYVNMFSTMYDLMNRERIESTMPAIEC